ncbi:8412_t:CDS:2 [Entrophospora sp. SA101]|nr:8412_t:CDS:2 [Entrophospora sp. SA101]
MADKTFQSIINNDDNDHTDDEYLLWNLPIFSFNDKLSLSNVGNIDNMML